MITEGPPAGDGQVPAQLPDLRRAPAERAARAVLPASAVIWTAAEIMHAAARPGTWYVFLGSAAASGLAFTAASHGKRKAIRDLARPLLVMTGTAGGWMTVSSALGPLDWWPYPVLTGAWVLAAWRARRWALNHEKVIEAREFRMARADWLDKARRWSLGGSHLLRYNRTRLGEQYEISTKGTKKRASQFASGNVAELIAEDHDLPVSRVQVRPHRLAGRITISVRHEDPWAHPIPHPVLAEAPELDMAGPYSITELAVIGQDPETGAPLDLLLCGPHGGRNINVLGTLDAGKTTLLNDFAERVTAARDALLIKINVSVKGDAEKDLWAPACHLTALGPKQTARAVKVMNVLLAIMEWRSQQPQGANWVPSARDPHFVVEIDEIDEAARNPAFRQALKRVASKGREYGITIIRSGQRATSDWTGGADTRALDGVFCLGKVRSQGEVYHAAGNLGLDLPDMSSYGEGKSGVWVFAELGGGWKAGRSFLLKDPDDIRRIAAERARTQPDLCPELRAFLGESYEILLSTDVFAKWARDQDEQAGREFMAGRPRSEPAGPAEARASASVLTDNDPLSHLESTMDDESRTRMDALNAKLSGLRETRAETQQLRESHPEVDPQKLAEHTAARWRMVAEQTEIPENAMGALTAMLAEGTTIRAVAEHFGITKWVARTWLEKLRQQGAVRVEGTKRTARWLLVTPEDGDGS